MKRRIFLRPSAVAGASFTAGACWAPAATTRTVPPSSTMGMDLEAMADQVLATDDVDKLALSWVTKALDSATFWALRI